MNHISVSSKSVRGRIPAKTHMHWIALAVLLLIYGGASISLAQTSSGTITGRVVDQSGGIVMNAEVRLINQLTADVVSTKVQSDGGFVFADVQPGSFTVDVRADGYKGFLKKDLVLSSAERLSSGTLVLEVGS
ncbi:MAG TPA: carboxypeptidase-like regulatory domain-containing protein, partial [Pseudacidobacterium sp.]|nr:carboxypeptidase-like regulatory domain-containing protein [Pseudacidobacterium sp.]